MLTAKEEGEAEHISVPATTCAPPVDAEKDGAERRKGVGAGNGASNALSMSRSSAPRMMATTSRMCLVLPRM